MVPVVVPVVVAVSPVPVMILVTEPSVIFRMRMPKGAPTIRVHARIVVVLDWFPVVVVVLNHDSWLPFDNHIAFAIARPVEVSRERRCREQEWDRK